MGQAIKVLVIEADKPAARLLAWGLSEEGDFDVITHGGVPEGDVLAAARPDVIVINTSMHADAKRSWINALRYVGPTSSIIDLVEDGVHDTGADAYVLHPFGVAQLVAAIERVLPERGKNDPGS
jgi:DNA-binding response OmpR family regulator